jgi:hypothetical protein
MGLLMALAGHLTCRQENQNYFTIPDSERSFFQQIFFNKIP